MSKDQTAEPRRAGRPVYERRPELRLVPSPDETGKPEPDPGLKEVLDDMRRRYRVQRERLDSGGAPDAA